MTERLLFANRAAFREWLAENALSAEGVWLVFGKQGGPETLTAAEALEEALCFGWIDGQVQSIDEGSYIKYFKQRGKTSNWSEKNKRLAESLESRGLMTDYGRAKIAMAKESGRWDPPKPAGVTEEQVGEFEAMLRPYEEAYEGWKKMAPSARRAYAASYFLGAKTEAGREKRFATIVERLRLGLNPMESMKKRTGEG